MKVCIFTQQFGQGWSGIGTYATNLVNGLVQKGIEVVVVCPTGMYGDSPDIRILEIPMKGWEKKVNYWLPLAWRFGIVLRMLAKQESLDLAHFIDAREALFAPRGIMPLVGTVNDYYPACCPLNPLALKPYYVEWPARWFYWRIVRILEQVVYRKLDRVASNADYVKQILVEAYRLPPQKIDVIKYGLEDIHINDPIVLEGSPSILFVGANFQRKGLPQLLRALAIVRSHLPGVFLHVVGDDSRRNKMELLAAELGVIENVRFMGGRPNEEVRRMKPAMFVMPSLIEGFGIVFLEAMLAGVPVIGGRTGGTVELIRDGKNGFTTPPGDVEDLAKKILLLTKNNELRENLIQEGKSTAHRYTVARMSECTVAMYDKVRCGE